MRKKSAIKKRLEGKKRLELMLNNNIKVLSGRNEGREMRKKLNLDVLDQDDEEYIITVPDVFSVTASYFLACFGASVRMLGKERFCKKYSFDSRKETVMNNIQVGIESAIRLDMPF